MAYSDATARRVGSAARARQKSAENSLNFNALTGDGRMASTVSAGRRAAIWFLPVALTLAVVAAAGAQTPSESARTAIRPNPRVDVVTSNRQAVGQELERARGQYYPQVDLRGAIGPEWSDNSSTRSAVGGGSRTLTRQDAGVFAVQRVFDGWETDSEVEGQKGGGGSGA